MSADRERLEKVLAIAVNPGAYEGEAMAALRKARELVKKDPSLAHPPPAPPAPAPKPAPPGDESVQIKVTHIPSFWLNIFLNKLSEQAYGLGLKSKLVCDFKETSTAVDVRCDGSKEACAALKAHLNWLINYINSQPPRP
jgi:hypothetical protein